LEYLLTILYTALFILLIYHIPFFKTNGISKKVITVFFIIKVFAGVTLSLIYTFYYTDRSAADIFKYFDDSRVMYDALFNKPIDFFKMLFGINNDTPYFNKNYYDIMNNWYRPYEPNVYNDNHTIIRFNAAIRLVSFGYYNVHTVFMCFISTIGLVALFKTFISFIKEKRKELALILFLIPSVLFWGSGVLKEGLLLFGLGLLLLNFTRLVSNGFSIRLLIGIVVGIVILAYMKYYILTILIPLLISYFFVAKTNDRLAFIKYLMVIILFFGILLNIHRIFPHYNVLEILSQKQNSFVYLAEKINAGSLYDNNLLRPTFSDFIIKSPKSLCTVFFRPFIFEVDSPFILLAAIENLFFLILLIFTIFFIKFKKEQNNILLFCIFFVIITFILTGLTTPVLGAIVRYKVPALPFLALIFLLLIDKEKLLQRFKFLNKIL
jgi:hypothetical protein